MFVRVRESAREREREVESERESLLSTFCQPRQEKLHFENGLNAICPVMLVTQLFS